MKPLALLLLLLPFTASATDAGRISFLEQEVRNLQRQVLAMSRQIDELRTRPDRPAVRVPAPREGAPAESTQWVDAKLWRQLRPGMSELEVIGALGPPTTMREENGARVLLYALEVGSSGFLGGSVTLRDRVVTEVRQPVLQ